ncbi:AAA family ATPase [Vibrio crassostreae]|uniref:AAA family ATPase n=1 Tax=Vibrio crassostreae TaxID=246167 RepID=UPI00104DAFE5|nr:AAA family ATPase [Vibrio crassostreae]TCV27407.1 putative AbiEii toxin of type IV toxin-antitoxin system [Vibrio crassostreae]
MKFILLKNNMVAPQKAISQCYLEIDNWNDFSFVTAFSLSLHDENGIYHEIGNVRIGFSGQRTSQSTHTTIGDSFTTLESKKEQFFSLGMSSDYYRNLAELSEEVRNEILTSLQDVVFDKKLIDYAIKEDVFKVSLLRDTSMTAIEGKYQRVLSGLAELTPYDFEFLPPTNSLMKDSISFHVKDFSKPSTNIHAIIGKNGTGKTTLFNQMIDSIVDHENDSSGYFVDLNSFSQKRIGSNYFSSLISVSFSAFDTHIPPRDQDDPEQGTCYFYVGLKDPENEGKLRDIKELREDLFESIIDCLRTPKKSEQFLDVIESLDFDDNIALMDLRRLKTIYHNTQSNNSNIQEDSLRQLLRQAFDMHIPDMSSGHAVVLLSLFNLVATVDEKSLVLIDEPESHLHPPLLSAYIRALSKLLHNLNGVGIIATHSPVVLQEIPKSCVWKMLRSGGIVRISRPSIETFGENVGVLTREVFGLEVDKSGFTRLLSDEVDSGKSFDDIYIDSFNKQLGNEGLILLKTLISNRDNSGASHD